MFLRRIFANSIIRLTAITSLVACVPDIHLIDRATVMELEGAGEWPQFEREFIDKGKAKGTTMLPTEPQNNRKERVFAVLNGEFSGVE